MTEAVQRICELLSGRRVTLFLGAGMNVAQRRKDGLVFPLGDGLAELICRDILGDELLRLTLDEASEYARQRVGDEQLNKYLFDLFDSFGPGPAHIDAVQLPWDTVYTTNFDLLLEKAQEAPGIPTAGRFYPIVTFTSDLADLTEDDIPYYKLHGSVDVANTKEGRLILTKEDYRYYEKSRRLLFNRLRDAVATRTFLFLGYSMLDSNFREILEDCREEMNVSSLPPSYAVRPGFRPAEADFWKEKYNIELIDSTADEFLALLKQTWFADGRSVIPLQDRLLHDGLEVEPYTTFPKYNDCFFHLMPSECKSKSDPKAFFRGAEPTWADIRDEVPPPREVFWPVMEALFDELNDPLARPGVYLITGHAGTGKTTLLRSLAFSVARDFEINVLVHIPGTPLDIRQLRALVDTERPCRLVILVENGGEHYEELSIACMDAKRFDIPTTFLVEERLNQWGNVAEHSKADLDVETFQLGSLSASEIDSILDALEKHGALGRLEGLDRAQQSKHFEALADRELLVALRELTTGTRFDDIVRDEYRRIPSTLAREAYAYVSALGQADLYIRYATLLRVLNCSVGELTGAVLKPTEGILITSALTGRSRHTIGFRLRSRHPIVASIVFAAAAPSDEAKVDILNSILDNLDPGFREDSQLLNAIARRRGLVGTLASVEKQRGIYDRLAQLMPDNPYVSQHRSILERSHGNMDEAIRFARLSRRMSPTNPAIANTLGLALEAAARSEKSLTRRHSLVSESSSLFDEGVRSAPQDPFGYLGQVYVLRQQLDEESSRGRRAIIQADILSLLESAREATDNSPIIEREFAGEQERLGKTDDAIEILEEALKRQQSNERVRNLLVSLLVKQEKLERAVEIAAEGLNYSPNSWRLNRAMARAKALQGGDAGTVAESYEAAIRNNAKDPSLYVELGAYLFENAIYGEADKAFSRAERLPLSSRDRYWIRQWFCCADGRRRVFTGSVEEMAGSGAFVRAVPDNFRAYFWRGVGHTGRLVKGDKVEFEVGFNCRGARAEITGIVTSQIEPKG